jgi:hypothetical protein
MRWQRGPTRSSTFAGGRTTPGDLAQYVFLQVRQFGHIRYATGVLAGLDLTTGKLIWVNRGHLPVIIRGRRWATTVNCPTAGPMGTDFHLPVTVCTEQLEPGDRLLLFTDGITEARDADRKMSGLERFTDCLIRHHLTACPSRKPCAASCTPSLSTTTDDSKTTPPCCSVHGTATASRPAPPRTGPNRARRRRRVR